MNSDVFYCQDTYHALRITILTTHSQIKSEEVTVDNIVVASLGSSQCVDTSIKWLICFHLNSYACIFAVDRH